MNCSARGGSTPHLAKPHLPSVHSHPACTLRVVRESCESRASQVHLLRAEILRRFGLPLPRLSKNRRYPRSAHSPRLPSPTALLNPQDWNSLSPSPLSTPALRLLAPMPFYPRNAARGMRPAPHVLAVFACTSASHHRPPLPGVVVRLSGRHLAMMCNGSDVTAPCHDV